MIVVVIVGVVGGVVGDVVDNVGCGEWLPRTPVMCPISARGGIEVGPLLSHVQFSGVPV